MNRLSTQQKIRYYRTLNLPSNPEPTPDQVRESYEQLRMAYEARARNPVTSGDFYVQQKYRGIKQAYDRLMVQFTSRNLVKNTVQLENKSYHYSVDIQDLLELYYENPKKPVFEVLHHENTRCRCKKTCETCRARQSTTLCNTCQGRGWVPYCDRCNKTGVSSLPIQQVLPLAQLNDEYFWQKEGPSGEYTIHLHVVPRMGLSLRDGVLIYEYPLSLARLVKGGTLEPVQIHLTRTKIKRVNLENLRTVSSKVQVPLDEQQCVGGIKQINMMIVPSKHP